ncbi:MAG TPA: hypothetical protein VG965_06585 [Patescibacteria group bacterium]|nr:hypothetical protein [Patescibacteria group bacterium]
MAETTSPHLEIHERQPSNSLVIEGGIPLHGSHELQGAKNLALQLTAIALLADGPVTLNNVPNIRDVQTNIDIINGLGGEASFRSGKRLIIDAANISSSNVNARRALESTGSRYYIPALVRRNGYMTTGPSGGDDIGGGDRYQLSDKTLELYRAMGIGGRKISDSNGIEVFEFVGIPGDHELKQANRYFGPTMQALIAFAKNEHGDTMRVINPSIEPEVTETVRMLRAMGADIHYSQKGREVGEDYFEIRGEDRLSGVEFDVMSDPNEMVTYAAAAIATNGDLEITNVDYSQKTEVFFDILRKMNVIYEYDYKNKKLELYPSRDHLKPVNLAADFWPAVCHTDWQQLLTPVLAMANGESIVSDKVYPSRFTSVDALTHMGADLTVINPQVIKINGSRGFQFSHGELNLPHDVRGASSVLIAALAANGRSVIHGVDQISRGLEDAPGSLRKLGAHIQEL